MSAADAVKQAGWKSLRECAAARGVHEETIRRWYKSKPRLFAEAVKR